MSVGTYYASAVISASAAVNSPRHVTIVLSVIEPDSLVIPDVDAEPAQEVIVPILLSNVDQLKALTLPLAFDPTYVFLDSASFIGSRIAGWPAKAVAVNNQLGTAVFSGNSPSAPLAPGSGIIGHVFLHVYPDIAGLISMDMDTTSIGQTTLAVIDTSGTTIIPSVAPGQLHIAGVTGIVNDSQSLNHELPGLVNYPNPFNSETVLIIRGQISADTRLVIYDVLGRVLCDLSGKIGHTGGTNRVIWDGTNDAGRPLGSGIYFAMLRSAHDYVTQKIVLLR